MTDPIEIRRTVCVKLALESYQEHLLEKTINQYREAANRVVEEGWNDERGAPETLDRKELHDTTYETVRDKTDLHASHVQLARNRAAEAMTAIVERGDQGASTSKPRFSEPFLDFHNKCFTIKDDYATLATVDGRVRAEFVLPDDPDTPHQAYLLDDEYEPGRSTLVRDGEYYLHVNLKKSVRPPERQKPWVLGIDLGISNLAVTSTGQFWSGDCITHWRENYQTKRRRLQQRNTRWSREVIQRVSTRLDGRVTQYLQTAANEIVEEAVESECSVIAFEDLDYIYEDVQQYPAMRSWAYRSLINYVSYKSKPAGITVGQVSPENTSLRCSTCEYVDTANRPTQEHFECTNCGYENHADYNAAKNIGRIYLQRNQIGDEGDAPAGVRVNSGLITKTGFQRLPAADE